MRQHLLAAVPPDRMFRLRALDPDRYHWIAATSWVEAVSMIRSKPVDIAIVDPLLGGEARAQGIARLRLLFPSLPLLIYTELLPTSAGALLELGRVGIRRVIFQRYEDAPGAMRSALQAELELSVSQQVMLGLELLLQDLPRGIREALGTMLHASEVEGPTVTTLAARSHLTRRSCERWFTKLGLPSPRTVMVLTRILYAHRLLLDPGYTVEDVALKLGYGKAKTLQMHLRSVFGVTAGELRVSLTIEEAMLLIGERYFGRLKRAVAS